MTNPSINHLKINQKQYRAALVICGAFKGTSRDCLCKELGLESRAQRRWSRKLFISHKMVLQYMN